MIRAAFDWLMFTDLHATPLGLWGVAYFAFFGGRKWQARRRRP